MLRVFDLSCLSLSPDSGNPGPSQEKQAGLGASSLQLTAGRWGVLSATRSSDIAWGSPLHPHGGPFCVLLGIQLALQKLGIVCTHLTPIPER